MSEQATASKAATEDEGQVNAPIIIHMGKHKKRRVRRLKKGKGRLTGDVMNAVADLQDSGEISGSVQPVVVIVRQKRRKSKMRFW